MGKATILEALGEGQYTVRVDTGKAQRDANVARLTVQIATLEQQIAAWQQTLDAFEENEEAPARAAVEAAQTAYIIAMKTTPPPTAAAVRALITAHSAALKTLFEVRARSALLRLQLDAWRLELAQARKDLAAWQAVEVEFDQTAWCADYTEAAAGDVPTLEIPGEYAPGGASLVLAPREVPPTLPAGQIVAREVQTGAQAYFNAAILPGWQRHMPTYRAGTITSINRSADSADVLLDATPSSAQDLDINQTATLAGVPVRYMTCNAAAFEIGDRVVVEFQAQDWAQPVVIGFVERPRACDVIVLSRTGARMVEIEPDVFVSRQYNVEFFRLRPGNFATDLRGELFAVDPGGGSYVYYDSPPFFWRGKVWVSQRSSPDRLPQFGIVRANDGETINFGMRAHRWCFDGAELVALDYDAPFLAGRAVVVNPVPRTVVINPETGETGQVYDVLRYTGAIGPLSGVMKARNGKLAAHINYDGHFVQVWDHRTDTYLYTISLPGLNLVDLAISRRYVATLTIDSGSDMQELRLYNIANGAMLDSVPLGTAGVTTGLSLTDAHAVAVDMRGAGGFNVARVYRIEGGDLVFDGSSNLFGSSVDTGVGYGGN